MRSFLSFASGFGGVGVLAGLLLAFLPGSPAGWIREPLVLSGAGNLVAAPFLFLPAFAIVAMLRRWRRLPAKRTAALAFWVGAVLGAMPLIGAVLVQGFGVAGSETLGAWAGLVLLPACPLLARRAAPGMAAVIALLLVTVAIGGIAGRLLPPSAGQAATPQPLDSAFAAGAPVSAARPDVILISIDTLRADAVVGPASAELPTLDRLRREGAWADHARSSSNQTVPGHVGLLSGLSASRHGVLNNQFEVPPRIPLMSQRFREAGWRTVACVSNGLLRANFWPENGFEVYDDSTVRLQTGQELLGWWGRSCWAGWLTSRAALTRLAEGLLFGEGDQLRALWGNRRGEIVTALGRSYLEAAYRQPAPLFLFLHYMDAHAPYRAPEPWFGRRQVPPPAAGEDAAGRKIAENRSRYLEEVEYVDHCLASLLETVETSGRPAVVLVTSDHGEFFGEHGLTGHAKHAFEEVLLVPFLLWGQGVPAVKLPPPFLADAAPTLLGLAGISRPEGEMDGLDLLSATPSQLRGRVHVARDRRWAAVYQQPWKWLGRWQLEAPPERVDDHHFVDLDTSPTEDAWGEEASGVPDAFRRAVEGWLRAELAKPIAAPDGKLAPERRDALEQLGYVDPLDEQ